MYLTPSITIAQKCLMVEWLGGGERRDKGGWMSQVDEYTFLTMTEASEGF